MHIQESDEKVLAFLEDTWSLLLHPLSKTSLVPLKIVTHHFIKFVVVGPIELS